MDAVEGHSPNMIPTRTVHNLLKTNLQGQASKNMSWSSPVSTKGGNLAQTVKRENYPSVLHKVAKDGDIEALKTLLRTKKVEFNRLDPQGYSALGIAIKN